MRVAADHPANEGILSYLAVKARDASSVLAPALSAAPDAVDDPHYNLGTHPDLMEWFWDGLTRKLPEPCKWIVYGTPTLVHPTSGIVFGFAGGTHTYALRLDAPEREAAQRAGAQRVHNYPAYPALGIAASELNLAVIGPEWYFGGWFKEELDWCLTAYYFADQPRRQKQKP